MKLKILKEQGELKEKKNQTRKKRSVIYFVGSSRVQ